MPDWVDFAAVKQSVSMKAVLEYYGVAGLRGNRDRLAGRCPIHSGRRDDSFRASFSKNAFQCFGCQARGNVLDFVAAMEGCSIREAALRLQGWFDIGATRSLAKAGNQELVRKKERFNPPLRFALTGVNPGHEYLLQRGIDRLTALHFGVGLYSGPGLLSGRIVIPIGNGRGEIVAYAGRALGGSLPKYKLPAGFRKSLELFNLHRAVATGSKTIIVVEGYFDCVRVHQAGLPWVVALMGSSLSAEQESALHQNFQHIILMLDGDGAGRAGSRAIMARFSGTSSVSVIDLPDDTQPDQLSPASIRDVLHKTISSEGRAVAFPPHTVLMI
jgi:DNA primase